MNMTLTEYEAYLRTLAEKQVTVAKPERRQQSAKAKKLIKKQFVKNKKP